MKLLESFSEHKNKFIVVVTLAATIGLLLGVKNSLAFIISNKYFEHKMYYLAIYWFSSMVSKYTLIALIVGIFVLIILIVMERFLKFLGVNRKHSDLIIFGIIPALLLLISGGYWINRIYLRGFFELESILGNITWLFICALLGWIILKISQAEFGSASKIYGIRILVAILFLVAGFNAAKYFYPLSPVESGQPNLILISIDTLRADHLSCYDYNRNTSQNIDLFAEDGVLFKNTIAQSSWTLPSHMSLLTGLYPSSHGVILGDRKLNDRHLTLAEVLKNAGYRTIAFTDGGYLSHKYSYQGFDQYDSSKLGFKKQNIERTYNKSVNWLRENHSEPFFLFLHTYQVHAPFDPLSDFDIYSDKKYKGIVEVSGNDNYYYRRIEPKMNREDYLYVIDKYDGEIYYTDYFLGKLFAELRHLGLYDRSVIVVTSDHGEHFLDHPDSPKRYVGHVEHKLYDEIVKIPLIIKAPGFPQNQIIDAQVESIDMMPTVLELLGISIPKRLDGESLVELVKKQSYDSKVFAFSETFYPRRSKYGGYRMIRSNNWKLLLKSGDKTGPWEIELYNLQADPEEKSNLIAEEQEMGKSLFAKLAAWVDNQREKSNLPTAEEVKLDDELVEQLKALGYIN